MRTRLASVNIQLIDVQIYCAQDSLNAEFMLPDRRNVLLLFQTSFTTGLNPFALVNALGIS